MQSPLIGAPCPHPKAAHSQSQTDRTDQVGISQLGKPDEETVTTLAPDVRLVNGEASYLHADMLGSVRLISNGDGAWTEKRIYRPFGQMQSWNNPDAPDGDDETRGWIDERYDAGAGLQYLNARYDDPELALFLQPDWFEVTEPGVGTNRYTYSFNDPVNLIDSGGNETYVGGQDLKSFPLGTRSLHVTVTQYPNHYGAYSDRFKYAENGTDREIFGVAPGDGFYFRTTAGHNVDGIFTTVSNEINDVRSVYEYSRGESSWTSYNFTPSSDPLTMSAGLSTLETDLVLLDVATAYSGDAT